MKNTLQNHSKQFVGLIATVVLIFIGISAQAQILIGNVVLLTGGDPSGGLTLNTGNVIDALYTPFNTSTTLKNTTQVFQGVTFTATNANITRGTTGGQNYLNFFTLDTSANTGFTHGTPTTQDSNLLALMNAGLNFSSQATPAALTLTINNLAPNTNYRIDSLISLLGYSSAARTDSVAYNGGAVSDTISYPAPPTGVHNIYDMENTVQSNGSGQIVVDYSGSGGPFYSALVVSSIVTVPEPSTLAMMLGGLGLFIALRLRRFKSLIIRKRMLSPLEKQGDFFASKVANKSMDA